MEKLQIDTIQQFRKEQKAVIEKRLQPDAHRWPDGSNGLSFDWL
jgi:hypothetical protein